MSASDIGAFAAAFDLWPLLWLVAVASAFLAGVLIGAGYALASLFREMAQHE